MDDIVKKFINLEGLSDIHIRSNKPVSLRINGEINKQEIVVSENQINSMIKKLLDDRKKEIFEKKKDVDLAFVSNNIRFRANIFQSSNGPAIVLRKINDIVPEISSLNLPPVINDVIREKAGLLAYSPLAVGYLTGKYRNKQIPKNSRLDLFYDNYPRYHNQRTYDAVDEYFKIAQKHKISLAQLSLAFVNSRDFVTSNIIGATTMKQLKENIDSIKISLDQKIIEEINLVHENNPNPAP